MNVTLLLRSLFLSAALALSIHVRADEAPTDTTSLTAPDYTLYNMSFSSAASDGGTPFWITSHTHVRADEAATDTTSLTAPDYTLYNMSFSSAASDGGTPFWITSHTHGRMPTDIDGAGGYVQAGIRHVGRLAERWRWEAGLKLVAATPRLGSHIFVQEAYAELTYRDRLALSIGSREWEDESLGGDGGVRCDRPTSPDAALSSGDLLLSPNARPIPEIALYTPRFTVVPLTGGWLLAGGDFAVGRSFDTDYLRAAVAPERHYVRDVLWHRKALYLQLKDPRQACLPLTFTLGIRHMAQWGGTSTQPKMGRQPMSVKDFLRIVLGQSGGSDATVSDQINVLGNHYGTFDFRLDYTGERFGVAAYYQHFWEDRSGIEWYNGMDGLMGVCVDLKTFPQVRRVVVERLGTMDQSGPFHFIQYDHKKYPGYGGGADNYYNNGEYTTGASYFGRAIGSPLLRSPAYNADGAPGFLHNRIRAWHVGAEGDVVGPWAWRARLTALRSFGTPYAPTLRPADDVSVCVDVRYRLEGRSARRDVKPSSGWVFTVSLAADRGDLMGRRTGVGLTVSRWGRW